jgi:hypothetical protein
LIHALAVQRARHEGPHLRAFADDRRRRHANLIVAPQRGERDIHRRDQLLAVLNADVLGLDARGDVLGIAFDGRLLIHLGQVFDTLSLGPLRELVPAIAMRRDRSEMPIGIVGAQGFAPRISEVLAEPEIPGASSLSDLSVWIG